MTTDEAIGYEAATVTDLGQFRRRSDAVHAETRANLRALCIDAMLGNRRRIPSVERRLTREVVADAPLAEVLAECMDTHVVHHAILDVLRTGHGPLVDGLRTALALRYAEKYAPRIVELGGLPA